MRYHSREEIEEMKRNGCEISVIEEARAIQEKADAIIAIIQDAFNGVELEDGIGLLEADGIDDYKSEEELAALREKDIKVDWQSITPDYINKGWCSTCYYDPKGMRFYLPAYMVADIKSLYRFEFEFTLTGLDLFNKKENFSLLNSKQRYAVKRYLEYLMQNNDGVNSQEIKDAIMDYWGAE